jgi:DNA mismatch repair ATPase MutS
MSGKSTLLRTTGCNVLLALAGAPVCAERLRLSSMQIATVMRISDSLQDGKSLFYAVISRLKSVVDLTSNSEWPLLFLLDEILQGTNSHDRRVGTQGIIQKLLSHGAIGLITTHDLALTEIIDDLQPRAINQHFADDLSEGQMTFDYCIHPGVVQKSNALALMRMMGLEV